jgi:hypothetical protein
MNYTVIWRHRLLPQLADFFNRAREQGRDANAVTRAVAQIDALLQNDPASRGESRPAGERVLIVAPLSVHFEVYEDERVVFVTSVRYFAPR